MGKYVAAAGRKKKNQKKTMEKKKRKEKTEEEHEKGNGETMQCKEAKLMSGGVTAGCFT
jgi:hypothetical protein